jgi:glycosyltransferase involved in cell wall biosynthesis
MKIAFVYDNLYPWMKGGVDKRVWELARHVVLQGHEVQIFTMNYWDGPTIIEREGVQIHGVCKPLQLYVRGRRSISEPIWFAAALMVPLLRQRFDILDVQQMPYFPCFTGQLATLVRRQPWVVTWHEVWGDYWYEYLGWRGGIGKLVEQMVARLGDSVIAVSPHTADALRPMRPKGTIHVVPNGVDITGDEPIPSREKQTDFIFVGRFIKEKNIDLLVRAIGLLRESGINVNCCLVGDGPEWASIRSLVKKLDLDDYVTMTGLLDGEEVNIRRNMARVGVLPSRREGYGITVLEAYASGLPVVTTRHPQNAATQLVRDGETGLVADLSVPSLACAMAQTLENAPKYQKACLEVAALKSWAVAAGHLLDVFKVLV